MMPFVSPVTVMGLEEPVALTETPEAVQVAVYPVMVAPPFDAGAVKTMLAVVFPAVAAAPVGAPGTVTELAGAVLTELPPQAPKKVESTMATHRWVLKLRRAGHQAGLAISVRSAFIGI